MSDRHSIQRLYADYLWYVDTRQWAKIAREIFSEDGELTVNDVTAAGRDEIEQFFSSRMSQFEATAHYLTNLAIDISGSDHAEARSYVLSFHWTRIDPGDDMSQPDFLGTTVYLDELRKDADRWWLTARRRRKLGPGHVGMAAPERMSAFE